MKKIIIIFLIIINISPCFADFTTYRNPISNSNNFNSKLKMNQPKTIIDSNISTRHNRLYPRECPRCSYNNPYLSKNDLYALEKYALNRTYRRESDLERLERLENFAFGSRQYGDINSRYQNVENAILSRPKANKKQSFLNNVANYFAGQTTGFTPNLIPYPQYNNLGGFTANPYAFTPNPGYSNNQYEQYSNGIFGGGWGFSGNDFGTGSSIRILD